MKFKIKIYYYLKEIKFKSAINKTIIIVKSSNILIKQSSENDNDFLENMKCIQIQKNTILSQIFHD